MSPHKHLFLSIATLLVAATTSTAHADGFAQFDTRLRYDSNLGNAKQPYIVGDSSLMTSFTIGKQHFIDDSNLNFSYAAKLSNESFNQLTGLSRTGAGLQISGKNKFGLGPYAPSLSLGFGLERQAFRDKERNGTLHQIELKASKRLSEVFNLWASLANEKNHADHQDRIEYNLPGTTFETSNRIYKLNLDFAQSESSIWNISYAVRQGDVLVTTKADWNSNYTIARAIHPDKSFGVNRNTYRLDGSTQTLSAGLTHSIDANWSVNLNLQKNWTTIPAGMNYQRHGLSLSASYQF
ncbi:hypothetical protein [Undibacterium sp. Di24W]|uniref:hypothetical protein n=1 Tax=Undibacterium sp. Di24W TaxID=3413033 RepID=UPI003BF233B3